MNICALSRVNYWQGIKGGMDLHGKLLSEGMVKRGHQLSMISTRHPEGIEFEERNGVKIYYLKNTIFGSRRNGWKQESVNKLIELHRKTPFDVIWSQSFDGYGLKSHHKSDLNVPVVATLHGCIHQEVITFLEDVFESSTQPLKLLRNLSGLFYSYFLMHKRLFSMPVRVITVSHQVAKDIEKWYGRKTAKKCVTIHNGVDPQQFCPNERQRETIRKSLTVKANEILLLSAGRLVHEKGHHLAINVLRQIKKQFKNIKLMIVGNGNYRATLDRMVEENGLKNDVIFTGFIDNSDIINYYNAADIFLMPTLREEGLPFILLEIMSCAKPVIASQLGGNRSVIKDGDNGLFVNPKNVKEIENRVKLLIKNPELTEGLSLSARQTILESFNIDKMIEKSINVMHAVSAEEARF